MGRLFYDLSILNLQQVIPSLLLDDKIFCLLIQKSGTFFCIPFKENIMLPPVHILSGCPSKATALAFLMEQK